MSPDRQRESPSSTARPVVRNLTTRGIHFGSDEICTSRWEIKVSAQGQSITAQSKLPINADGTIPTQPFFARRRPESRIWALAPHHYRSACSRPGKILSTTWGRVVRGDQRSVAAAIRMEPARAHERHAVPVADLRVSPQRPSGHPHGCAMWAAPIQSNTASSRRFSREYSSQIFGGGCGYWIRRARSDFATGVVQRRIQVGNDVPCTTSPGGRLPSGASLRFDQTGPTIRAIPQRNGRGGPSAQFSVRQRARNPDLHWQRTTWTSK